MMAFLVSKVLVPQCGVMIILGRESSGWSLGSGSGSVTSKAAAWISSFFKASYKASWSTILPVSESQEENISSIGKQQETIKIKNKSKTKDKGIYEVSQKLCNTFVKIQISEYFFQGCQV